MAIIIDKSIALKKLQSSYERCSKVLERECKIQKVIDFVMQARNCLTYRYILFTALLAKSIEPGIDILSLQAQDDSIGSYDARSLAKDVVFVFQKTMLGNILDGANNDPLVNKPGRFKRLDKSNSTQSGDPKRALFMLCDELPSIVSAQDASKCVDYYISLLIKEKQLRDKQRRSFECISSDVDAFNLRVFLSDVLDQGFGGAALLLVTTAIYHILFPGEQYEIVPHPVNQSGMSKRQFSDLDVLKDGHPFMGTELKDKPFTESDVDHAAQIANTVGARSLMFIAGRQSSFASQPPTYFVNARKEYAKKGIYVGVSSIDDLMDMAIAMNSEIDHSSIIRKLTSTAESIGALEAQMWMYKRESIM